MNWRQTATKLPLTRQLLHWGETARSKRIIAAIRPYLPDKGNIIDIGAGTCVTAHLLQESGFRATAADIADFSVISSVEPVVFDGRRLPFEDQSFDCALVAFVLHHTRNPDEILAEAKRVATRVIVFEDVVTSRFHFWVTRVLDSLVNMEIFDHPHNNRSDSEWRTVFEELDLKLIHSEMKHSRIPFAWPILNAQYVLENGDHERDGNE